MEDQAVASTSMVAQNSIISSPNSSSSSDTIPENTQPINISTTSNASGKNPEKTKTPRNRIIKHAVVLSIIYRLQQWCSRLLWITVFTIISFCGERKLNNNQTYKDIRKSIASGKQRKSNTVKQLKMQLLEHLKQLQAVEQYKQSQNPTHLHHCHKRRKLSRPPSPQLFDILEDGSNESVD